MVEISPMRSTSSLQYPMKFGYDMYSLTDPIQLNVLDMYLNA